MDPLDVDARQSATVYYSLPPPLDTRVEEENIFPVLVTKDLFQKVLHDKLVRVDFDRFVPASENTENVTFIEHNRWEYF